MKSFTINDTQYHYPESLAEVSLNDFIELSKLEGAGAQLAADIVHVLTKVEKEILDEAAPLLVIQLYNAINPVLDVSKLDTTKLVRTFELDKVTYFTTAPEDISFAEYVAIEQITRQFEGKNESIPYLLATVCRLAGESYADANKPLDKMRQRVETMKKLDVQTAYSIQSFFCDSYQRSLFDFQNYSNQENLSKALIATFQEMLKKPSTRSSSTTTGQDISLTVLQRIWLRSILFLLKEQVKYSTTWSIRSIMLNCRKAISIIKKMFHRKNG